MQPFAGSNDWRYRADRHFGAANFALRLGAVASVSEQDASLLAYDKRGRAAGESAKVSDVGKMSDEKRVQMVGAKISTQLAQTSLMVHGERV